MLYIVWGSKHKAINLICILFIYVSVITYTTFLVIYVTFMETIFIYLTNIYLSKSMRISLVFKY